MARVVNLQPHDPLPTGRGDYITVVHRFKDDDPDEIVTEITVNTRGAATQSAVADEQGTHALRFEQALERAKVLADHNGIAEIFVVDRTAGDPERAVLAHHGERDAEEVGPGYDEAARSGAGDTASGVDTDEEDPTPDGPATPESPLGQVTSAATGR